MALYILNIIQSCSQRVVYVNDNNFPVCFFLVEQSHDAKDLDLFDLPCIPNKLSNFTDIKGIIIALCFRLGVNDVGVFPRLQGCQQRVEDSGRMVLPEGKHHSSRDSPCGESNCGHIEVSPSWCLEELGSEARFSISVGITSQNPCLVSFWSSISSIVQRLTSILALVHLGISTIILSTVCCSLA